MAHRNIFTGEWVLPEPPKKKARKQPVAERTIRPAYVGYSNDINGWYRENRPTTPEGCRDLRLAIKSRKLVGGYETKSYEASTGRKMTKVTGPAGTVMIVSTKAMKLFKRKIDGTEMVLTVRAEQGITT